LQRSVSSSRRIPTRPWSLLSDGLFPNPAHLDRGPAALLMPPEPYGLPNQSHRRPPFRSGTPALKSPAWNAEFPAPPKEG
jgi:hypothetical protein